jgi:hypothetical protein
MSQMTKSRKQRLRACEKVLIESMEEFVRVGMALKEIKDDKLYEEDGHADFRSYLKANRSKFEFTERHVYRLIEAADLRMKLPTDPGGHSPWTEKAVRELKRLPADTKAKAVAARVIKEVEQNGGKLTSTLVRKHVDEALGVDRKPKPKPKPQLHEVVSRWAGQLNGIADVIENVPDDAISVFAQDHKQHAKELAAAIERVEKSLERVWAALP